MAANEPRGTVKMKYVGHFKGNEKIVELPIPLVSNSMKLEQVLTFTRKVKNGPGFCDVPIEWAGALLAVGGNFQSDEKITPDLKAVIDSAKLETDEKMRKQALENELVTA